MTQEFRKIQPRTHNIASLRLIEPRFARLDNGIPVYTIHAGTEDLIKLDLIFDAGAMYQSQPLLATLTNKCLREGSANYSSAAIAGTVDFYGAHLRNATGKDDARLSLYCLGKHLDLLLPMLGDVVLQPVFPQDEVNTIISKSKQEFRINMEKVKFIAQLHFNGLIFGQNHPYASPLSEGDYDRITSTHMAGFHQDFYAQRPFKMIISGRLPGNILQKVNRYFGQHPVAAGGGKTEIPAAIPSDKNMHIIPRENSLQSAIRTGKELFNKLHPDYQKMKVVNTILGGYFGSRLMTNIREDKGYTYGIGSMISSFRHSGLFFIAAEVGTEVREKAVQEIFKEIENLRTDLVPEEELGLVKNYMLGSFMRSADGPFALSELVKSAVDFDLTMDHYNTYLSTVKNITAKEIRDLAVKYLDPSTMITLVAGK